MDGFKRPNVASNPQLPKVEMPNVEPVSHTPNTVPAPQSPTASLPPVDLSLEPSPGLDKKRPRRKWLMIILGAIVGLLLIGAIATYLWYQAQLQPVDASNTTVQRIEVPEGASLSQVADTLKSRGVIRSSTAFGIYAGLEDKKDAIKAGTCNFTPAESAQEILAKLIKGCHDFTSVTFYPGATLETSLYAKTQAQESQKEFKDPSIRASLLAAGFTNAQIDAAFAAKYESPLFAGKPASEGYEGYIFGETYYVDVNATAGEVLQTAFAHFYTIVQENELVAKFQAQGLTLYEGITLSSVVEKELDCEGKPTEERKNRCYTYQRQIAKVFLNRLELGMSLGSDVTSIYASDKLGVASSVDVDSPYNTRKYTNLPPGPIATPGKLALLAVANPAETDALYFLAGDDGLIYFASDESGHESNIKNHCQQLCGDL